TNHNTGTKVIQNSGGYTILGNFESGSTQKEIFIVFTDEFGRQKTGDPIFIGTDDDDHGYSMIRLVDGGYLISGSSSDADSIHGYLVNISSDGQILWEQTYSGYQELEFRDAYEADDGNLIITGYSKNNPGDDTDAILFKISAEGDLMWARSWGWTDQNYVGEAILEYQNRYHILTTSTDVTFTRLTRIRMLNTNTDGKAETSTLIDKEYLSGKDIALNAAGNMYILGNNQDPVSRESSIFLAELELVQVNQLTRVKDSASIPDPESLHGASFATVGENALAIGGLQVKQDDNDILFLLVENNFPDLTPLTRKTFGSKGYQASQDIIYTLDQGFALTGSVYLADGRISMLLKIDSERELK
ncbi:MAG: hypothetical protein KAI95_22640, partial [Bacteroidales bacterium]|nr:hypothetical protein [Bacteroidales bacterium]